MKKILIMFILGLCFYNIAFVICFDKKYQDEEIIRCDVEIISLKEETNYYNKYIVIKNRDKLIIYLNKNEEHFPGDILRIEGVFHKPETARNYKGFNYRNYLKQKKIYGTVNVYEEEYKETKIDIHFIIGRIQKILNSKIDSLYSLDVSEFLKGILIGNTNNIDENIKEDFRKSSISHILAISGLHITYLVKSFRKILFIFIKSRKKQNITLIIILIFFILVTGMSPSCFRACIMLISVLISELIHRKNSFFRSFIITFLVLLFINPFSIFNVGMWLSFLGTFGIVQFSGIIKKILFKKTRINRKTIELFSTNVSAQIMIIPVMIYSFNLISLSFFIPNFLISFLIGPIIFLGYLTIAFPIKIPFIIKTEEILIKTIFAISKLCSKIPFSNIYIKTPPIIVLLLYYVLVFYLIICFNHNKFYYLRSIALRRIPKEIKKMIVIYLIVIFIFNFKYEKNLKIFFVDVGQGDCTVITTPKGKNIIIDGGEDFDGKIVLPYLLDRGITKIDYMIVSHFDSDHVGGLIKVINELRVKNLVISRQKEISENYEMIKKLVKENNINVLVVEKGDTLNIEKNLCFNILWPNNKTLISENVLNNNSIVCKLHYKNFSMLFTGDIEEIAEKAILQENKIMLNSTVLKVGHHGSKTSSTQGFIEAVHPMIALIGVGKDNKFGHPNESVIERLEKLKTRIYRTDQMGEVIIIIDISGKVKDIYKMID